MRRPKFLARSQNFFVHSRKCVWCCAPMYRYQKTSVWKRHYCGFIKFWNGMRWRRMVTSAITTSFWYAHSHKIRFSNKMHFLFSHLVIIPSSFMLRIYMVGAQRSAALPYCYYFAPSLWDCIVWGRDESWGRKSRFLSHKNTIQQ